MPANNVRKRRREIGITDRFSNGNRCEKCDLLLVNSLYKDQRLVYSINHKIVLGFVCVRCSLFHKRTTKKDYDNYIAEKQRGSKLIAG